MMKHSVIASLSMAWLAVIFFIAAAGAPHYYTYDKDNSVGAFRACSFGTCREYGSTLTDWGRGLQAMIVLAILTTIAGATVMTINLFKTFSYQHLIASVLMLFGALWGLIAMGIAADHFNGTGGWHLGASFVLNTLAWLLNLGSVGAYAYWVYSGAKGLHGETNAPTGSANV